jgi:hypothetical protein
MEGSNLIDTCSLRGRFLIGTPMRDLARPTAFRNFNQTNRQFVKQIREQHDVIRVSKDPGLLLGAYRRTYCVAHGLAARDDNRQSVINIWGLGLPRGTERHPKSFGCSVWSSPQS